MRRVSLWLITLSLISTVGAGTQAAVRPNPIFADGCVLQRGMEVPIWGTAAIGEVVTVKIQDQKVSAVGKHGKWMVKLKPLKAGGPFTMMISASNRIEIKNVLIGEVWLAGGQSNMAMPLSGIENARMEIAASKDPLFRMGIVTRVPCPEAQTESQVRWKMCNPESAGDFSAVAYYFGKNLRKTLGCPVAILNAARGGTRIETWMSDRALKPFDGQFEPKRPKTGANWNTASALWNGMIVPLVPYAMRGVIFYQGESNAGDAPLYAKTFPAMISDWRQTWGQGDFPFLFAQIAPFDPTPDKPQSRAWAELREAQLKTSQTVPNTAMAVTVDCGDCADIHPKRKKPVGERLALAARALAYGEDIVYKGPSYVSWEPVGNQAQLTFGEEELAVPDGKALGFELCGEDRVFYPARALVLDSTILVSADKVLKPVAVRYGWAECPTANLYNVAGLPASPFRTDDFDLKPAAK